MKGYFAAILCLLLCLSLSACAIEFVACDEPQPATPSDNAVASESDEVLPVTSLADGEVILFDNDKCSLTVLGMKNELPDSLSFDILLENKSDFAFRFDSYCFAINGWQIDIDYHETVKSGTTLRDTIEFSRDDLADMPLDSVDEVSFYWEVDDIANYYLTAIVSDKFSFYVSDPDVVDYEIKERSVAENETVIIDNEDYCYVVMEVSDNGSADPEVLCYLENRTDAGVFFFWGDSAVNRWGIAPSSDSGKTVMPGCRTYHRILFSESRLSQCGIEQIDELCFKYDVHNLDYEILFTGYAVVYPTGLTAADIPTPEHTPKSGETVLLDDERCTVIIDPVARENDVYRFGVYVHNRSADTLHMDIGSFRANGDTRLTVSPAYCSDFLPSDRHIYCQYEFDAALLSNSVSSVLKSLEFEFELVSYESSAFEQVNFVDSSAEPIFNETVTVEN